MKKIIVFLALSGLISFSAIGQSYTISGQVVYEKYGYNLDSCTVYLKDSTYTVLDSVPVYFDTITNKYIYSFSNLASGKYYVGLQTCYKYWGGGNSLDAWMICQHFAGQLTLTGIYEIAGDVMSPFYGPHTIDGFAVAQRFVHLITSFDSGDWVSNIDYEVVINSGNQTKDIYTLCFGDVNASFIPY